MNLYLDEDSVLQCSSSGVYTVLLADSKLKNYFLLRLLLKCALPEYLRLSGILCDRLGRFLRQLCV